MASLLFGKIRLKSDSHGWMVAEENYDSDGDPYLQNRTYFPSLQSALRAVLEHRLRSCPAEDIEGLLEELRDFRADLAQTFALTVVEPK